MPAHHLALTPNQAQWTISDDLWAGFVGEQVASSNGGGAAGGFRGSIYRIYYRVRFTPTGGHSGSRVGWWRRSPGERATWTL